MKILKTMVLECS
uniref:Uncharacterized protein n=1 Tax=Lepeophtheirus salmonis TaxID=72036 RepID=A0A0K2V4Q7_LEPSM